MQAIALMNAVTLICNELEWAEAQHPVFPTDPIHAVAIMEEESGEAIRAALQFVYEDGSIEALKKEIIQTGAMSLRCLINLHNFKIVKAAQK